MAHPLAGANIGTLARVAQLSGWPDDWLSVAGIWGASGESTTGHGVCAGDESWVFGVTTLSGPFASAAFHPNPAGQRSIGRQIARTLGLR